MNEVMTVLVAGASGATGRLLVQHLLERGLRVKAIVRSAERLPETLRGHARLSVVCADIPDLSEAELARHVGGCSAVASCLGHNLTLKGIFGQPRRLVTDATRRLCGAIRANEAGRPTRLVLMNTTGNRDLDEPQSLAERCVLALLRTVLPPQADNEEAAQYLRAEVGQADEGIEWVVVRPDTLIDEETVARYDILPSPTRSPVFNPGKTSRTNVAHFMADLITDDDAWRRWRGRMPVIYNRAAAVETRGPAPEPHAGR